jgi:hypothetical protein
MLMAYRKLKLMEELSTREAREKWCMQVEHQLSYSAEYKEDGHHPGLQRVRNLEKDIMKVVSHQTALLFSTDRSNYLFRLSQPLPLRFTSLRVLFLQIHTTLFHEEQALSFIMIRLYLMFSVRRLGMFRRYIVIWSLEFGMFLLFMYT